MKLSRQMVIGYLELIVAFVKLQPFVVLLPPALLPYLLAVGGVATVILRAVNGGFGINLLTAAGIIGCVAGVLSEPTFVAVIPLSAVPTITAIAGLLTVIGRYLAGQNPSDPAASVNALLRNGI